MSIEKKDLYNTLNFLQELTKVFNNVCKIKLILENQEAKDPEEYEEINNKLEKINKYFYDVSKTILNLDKIMNNQKKDNINEEIVNKLINEKEITLLKEILENIKTF